MRHLRHRARRAPGLRAIALSTLAFVTALSVVVGGIPTAQATTSGTSPYYVYAHGFGDGTVVAFSASDTGPVAPVAAGPRHTGADGWPVVTSPDGRFVYVGAPFKMSIFAVQAGGALQEIAGSPIALPDDPVDLVFSHDGRRAFLTLGAVNESIQAYTVSAGHLVRNGPAIPMGSALDGLVSATITPDGHNLYAASYVLNQIVWFRIGSDGRLTSCGRFSTGSGPIYPNVSPDGRHLYVSNERGSTISGYNITTTGALTAAPGSPYASGPLPHVNSFTPDSKYFYVPGGGIYGYAIRADGSLKQVPGSPFATTDGGFSMETVYVSPTGRALWGYGATVGAGLAGLSLPVNLGDNALRRYTIRADGSLSGPTANVDSGTTFADGRGITIAPAQ